MSELSNPVPYNPVQYTPLFRMWKVHDQGSLGFAWIDVVSVGNAKQFWIVAFPDLDGQPTLSILGQEDIDGAFFGVVKRGKDVGEVEPEYALSPTMGPNELAAQKRRAERWKGR